jgi:hypothetical protein
VFIRFVRFYYSKQRGNPTPSQKPTFLMKYLGTFATKMPSKPKTQRRETTPEERAIVWAHYLYVLTYSEIKAKTGHPKPTIQSIIKRLKARSGSDKFKSLPRPGASRKVDSKDERALLRHVDKNTKDPLTVLGMPFKSGK